MKKIFLGTTLIALLSVTAMATLDGGKKKAKKKAKTERKADKCEDKNCDKKCCDYKVCPQEQKCNTTAPAVGS